MMRLLLVLLLLPALATAQSISGVSPAGTAPDGGALVITGTSFGTKSPAAPIKWDQFEAGTSGLYLSDVQAEWPAYEAAQHGAPYSSDQAYSGSLSVANKTEWRNHSMDGFATNYYDFAQSDEVYCSYKMYVGASVGQRIQFKITRLSCSTGGGRYNGAGVHGFTSWLPYASGDPYGSKFNVNNGTETLNLGWISGAFNEWFHAEGYRSLGTAGSANGTEIARIIKSSGQSSQVKTSVLNRDTGYTWQVDTVLLGLMYANWEPAYGNAQMYIDDVYIDNTRARVFLGNRNQFANCTQIEMQIPSAWSATEITVTCNTGAFANGENAYLYVVDSSGNMSSAYGPLVVSTDYTPPVCTPPTVPAGVSATSGSGRVDLSWTASSGAASYRILRSTTSGSGYAQVGTTAGTSFANTGLASGVTYYYVVRAVLNATCESANSTEVSGTPTGGEPAGLKYPENLNAAAIGE